MKLTVVGCSGSFPGPESPASCYLVEHDGHRILLDLGNGALGPLQRHADLAGIDAVVLSHLHADHCLDLCGYYVVRRYHPAGQLPRLPVYGPRGTAAHLRAAYGLDSEPGDERMEQVFDFHELADGAELTVGPFRVRAVRVNHPVEAYALRVEADSVALTYSGDTGPCDALVELARGSDLLLCEAAFVAGRDHVPDLHLNGYQAGEHATRAEVGRLLLTHLPPWTDGRINLAHARERFAGQVELAVAGAVYPL